LCKRVLHPKDAALLNATTLTRRARLLRNCLWSAKRLWGRHPSDVVRRIFGLFFRTTTYSRSILSGVVCGFIVYSPGNTWDATE
jgi:CHASE1-domain containing sensor protein